MIKLGDVLKFDKYINYNYMSGKPFVRSLKTKLRIPQRTRGIVKNNIAEYNTVIINDELQEGIYVGVFKKKLSRKYRTGEEILQPQVNNRLATALIEVEEEELDALVRRIRTRTATSAVRRRIPTMSPQDRYSTNPRRIDDPRKLDKIAMLKVGRKLIGVPITNIYKCNYIRVL